MRHCQQDRVVRRGALRAEVRREEVEVSLSIRVCGSCGEPFESAFADSTCGECRPQVRRSATLADLEDVDAFLKASASA
jgi:hypothetical protein